MTEKAAVANRQGTEIALRYAVQMMDHGLRLGRLQMDVAERAGSTIGRECHGLLTVAEPSAALRAWPKVLESSITSGSEAGTAMLKNAMDWQTAMIKLMQACMQELNQQVVAGGAAATGGAGAGGEAAAQVVPARGKGAELQRLRTRKAA